MTWLFKGSYWLFVFATILLLWEAYANQGFAVNDLGWRYVLYAFAIFVGGVIVGGGLGMMIDKLIVQATTVLLALALIAYGIYCIRSGWTEFSQDHYIYGGGFLLGVLSAVKVAGQKYGTE